MFDAGPVVLDYYICVLNHALKDLDCIGILKVKGEAALVALQILEIGSVSGATHYVATFDRLRDLYLDHIGSPIGQLAHSGWPRPRTGQVYNYNV